MKTTSFLLLIMLLFIGLANADTIAPGNAEEEAVEWYITLLALLTPILGLYATWKFFKFLIKLASGGGTFTDPRDGKVYKTVKIGNQVWMAENLAYAGGGRYYADNREYGKKYGMLYDWNAALKACPAGWHLPSKDEWEILIDFAGGEKAGKKLKAKNGWEKYNGPDGDFTTSPSGFSGFGSIGAGNHYRDGNGTDDFGFGALPGGYCHPQNNYFNCVGKNGYWWSSSEENANLAHHIEMENGFTNATCLKNEKSRLMSVRCIKD